MEGVSSPFFILSFLDRTPETGIDSVLQIRQRTKQTQAALRMPSMGMRFSSAFTSRGTMIRSRIRVGTM